MQGKGTAPADILELKSGDKISAPNSPSAENYAFEGWYKDGSYAEEWNFDEDTISGNTTLYAKWIAHTHEWEYLENGASIEAYCKNDNPKFHYYGTEETHDNLAKITLTAPEKVYDGETYDEAELKGNIGELGAEGLTYYYEGIGTTEYVKSVTAPTAVGTYKVSIQLNEKTAQTEFQIVPVKYNMI